jgi:hypothetical protein
VAYHNILNKLDGALAAYVIAEGAGTEDDVYTAKRPESKEIPNTVCSSDSFTEEPARSGNFLVQASVHVITQACVDLNETADEITALSDERVASTFDLFYAVEDQDGSVLAAAVTAAATGAGITELTVFSVTVKGGDRGRREKDGAWVDTLELEIYCAASAIA